MGDCLNRGWGSWTFCTFKMGLCKKERGVFEGDWYPDAYFDMYMCYTDSFLRKIILAYPESFHTSHFVSQPPKNFQIVRLSFKNVCIYLCMLNEIYIYR